MVAQSPIKIPSINYKSFVVNGQLLMTQSEEVLRIIHFSSELKKFSSFVA